jgi:hypothetical protein
MYRLIEITYENDKESQAHYPFETKDALEGEYEDKLGTNMLANTDCILIGVDNIGTILFNAKVGEHEFAPRLYEAKYTTEEAVDLAKQDTVELASGRFHKKKGAAIKSADCRQEVLVAFDGNASVFESCHWVRTIEPTE